MYYCILWNKLQKEKSATIGVRTPFLQNTSGRLLPKMIHSLEVKGNISLMLVKENLLQSPG